MAVKRRVCKLCDTHTIVKKVSFKSMDPKKEFDIEWMCTPCITELGNRGLSE
jgi:RNase P subunit RPR2